MRRLYRFHALELEPTIRAITVVKRNIPMAVRTLPKLRLNRIWFVYWWGSRLCLIFRSCGLSVIYVSTLLACFCVDLGRGAAFRANLIWRLLHNIHPFLKETIKLHNLSKLMTWYHNKSGNCLRWISNNILNDFIPNYLYHMVVIIHCMSSIIVFRIMWNHRPCSPYARILPAIMTKLFHRTTILFRTL